MRPTPLYRAYSAATRLILPVAAQLEQRKVLRAGLGKSRAREKLGHASKPRPKGQLLWFHAASVGESLSILSLIERVGVALPNAHFLITSGTPTSAELIANRLPPQTQHQFAPLDAPAPLDRFLKHWQPDAAVFVESELWPQMLWRSHCAGVPLALLNARMSEKSVTQWMKRPKTSGMLLSVFKLILTQNAQMARAMVSLGADEALVAQGVNLKSLSAPLPQNTALIAQTTDALQGRPVWVASSTHEGEEQTVLAAHEHMLKTHPDLCLILAPRHPNRRDAVAKLITDHGWADLRRSADQMPQPGAPVYLADSLGELGSWYAVSDMVFLGGSLLPIGGHNPYEVAQAKAAVISGVHVSNFAETFSGLEAAGGVQLVNDSEDIARTLSGWIDAPGALANVVSAAQAFCNAQDGALDGVAQKLISALDLNKGQSRA
ncbi:MAG: 3-deoxy-D-manno-octulosonic acid transferase [Aliishimia sp.]